MLCSKLDSGVPFHSSKPPASCSLPRGLPTGGRAGMEGRQAGAPPPTCAHSAQPVVPILGQIIVIHNQAVVGVGEVGGNSHFVRAQRRHLSRQWAMAVIMCAKGVPHNSNVGGQLVAWGGGVTSRGAGSSWFEQQAVRARQLGPCSSGRLRRRQPTAAEQCQQCTRVRKGACACLQHPSTRHGLPHLQQPSPGMQRTCIPSLHERSRREPCQRAPGPLPQPHQHRHTRLVAQRQELAKCGIVDGCRGGRRGVR